MSHQPVNLSRKLRPKVFDDIIGQKLTVRMLRNGLYLDKLFPAYLFAGQRGCGKTSTARVFAAALNCMQLDKFREEPKSHSVPCTTCESCVAMQKNNHPDFMEVDAASNTGVDNIRQILEAVTYLPLIGRKKVYLIDETHMLSRAAFNALLKILEEPPPSVLFMLATTEPMKVPNTVRSRCFYASFGPIEHETQLNHLEQICKTENISLNRDALAVISRQSNGSLRDGINLLEQLASLGKTLDIPTIHEALGILSPEKLLKISICIMEKNIKALTTTLSEMNVEALDPQSIWKGIADFLSALLRTKLDVPVSTQSSLSSTTEQLVKMAKACPLNRIHALMQLFWGQEELFLKTAHKHRFLEHLLIQMTAQIDIAQLADITNTQQTTPAVSSIKSQAIQHNDAQAPQQTTNQTSPTHKITTETLSPWKKLLQDDSLKNDKLLKTIFDQANTAKVDSKSKSLLVHLPNINSFFQEKVEGTSNIWKPLLNKYFTNIENIVLKKNTISSLQKEKPNTDTSNKNPLPTVNRIKTSGSIDISDETQWPKTNLLVKNFPGKVEISSE